MQQGMPGNPSPCILQRALSIHSRNRAGLIKQSKAYVAGDLLEDGLKDANEVIRPDPSSSWGYERRHAALHRAGRYSDATAMSKMMLSKISQSPDLKTRERRLEYVTPAQSKVVIRKAVQNIIRDSPILTPSSWQAQASIMVQITSSLQGPDLLHDNGH